MTTPPMEDGMTMERIEVIQADREAAAKVLGGLAPVELLAGKQDSLSLVQAFARHRLAFAAPQPTGEMPRREVVDALLCAKRAIEKAALDTLWCDDSPAETVCDRIDHALSTLTGQAPLPLLAATEREEIARIIDPGLDNDSDDLTSYARKGYAFAKADAILAFVAEQAEGWRPDREAVADIIAAKVSGPNLRADDIDPALHRLDQLAAADAILALAPPAREQH